MLLTHIPNVSDQTTVECIKMLIIVMTQDPGAGQPEPPVISGSKISVFKV